MNRCLLIVVCSLALLVAGLCREGHKKPKDTIAKAATTVDANGYDPFTDTASLTTLFDRLLTLQTKIAAGNEQSVQRLIAASYDTIAGCIYVVGSAAVVLDSAGESNQARTALLVKKSANQWAFFNKYWITGQGVKFKSGFQGKVLYSRELLERRKNDTLEVLYLVPIGSVVVQ